MLCRPGLDLIVNPQRAERGGHHPVRGAHHQRRAEIVNEQVEKGHQHVQHQKTFREGAQTVLLAELDQQQVDGDVGHDVDRGKPGDFGRPGPEGSLQVLQVGGHHRISQRSRQAHQQANDAVGNAFWRTVLGCGRRTQQGGFLMWLPLARSIRVAFGQAHNVVYLRNN